MRFHAVAVFLLGLMMCVPADAEPPAILDHVPADAALVVVTRNMKEAQEHAAPLVKLLESRDDAPMRKPREALDKFLAAPGIKTDGSVAIVMPKAPPAPDPDGLEDPGEEPAVLVLVQVTDYAAFVSHLGGDPKADVASVQWDEAPGFARRLNERFALMGTDEQAVAAYSARGQMGAHVARLTPAGARVVEKADVAMIADAQAFKDQIESAPIDRAGMAGGLPMRVGNLAGPIGSLRDAIARDGALSVVGWAGGEAGQSLDFVAVFKPGSEMATMCVAGGDSGALLARLPQVPYYLAGAADLNSPLVRKILDAEGLPDPMANEEMPSAFDALSNNMKDAEGMGFVVGANKAGPMAGVFVNTVAYIASKDSKQLLGSLRERAEGMKDVQVGGAKVKVDYKRDVAEAHGVKFDAWSTTIALDPNDPNSFMVGMTMQTLFGQGKGFGQMAAAVDGGLVMTMSQNTPLMSNAIAAAQGGQGLGADASIASVREHLPGRHGFQLFVGTDAILEAVKTPLEDYLGEVIEVPANVPPIALVGGAQEGAMSMRLFVPAKVFDAVEGILKALKAADEAPEPMDGMDGGMDGT